MATWRMLVAVAFSWVEVVLPLVAKRAPPVPAVPWLPPTQMLVPSVLVAERGLLWHAKSVRAVDVSTVPSYFTMPTVRGTPGHVVLLSTVAPPRSVPYPVITTNLPSEELAMSPSTALPPPVAPCAISWLWPPPAVVGRATACTKAPAGVYSSRKTELPLLVSVCTPSPTR